MLQVSDVFICFNDVELQVTFVFTNQVDGKLVPVEGKVSPNTAAANSSIQNLKQPSKNEPNSGPQHQDHHQTVTSDGDVSNSAVSASCKIPQGAEERPPVRDLMRARPNIWSGTKVSIANKLPLKRLSSADALKYDDDFA